jgi:DNA polymerase-3 subunit beta
MIVLKAPQEQLLGALQAVSGIVERRHTLPILANVLLRKGGDDIELTTSDLEIQVRTHARIGSDTGQIPTKMGARKLIDILRTLVPDRIGSLLSSQNKLTRQGGKKRVTLYCLPAKEFPPVQEAADFGPAFSVPQKVLRWLFDKMRFAMAVHDIRYYLNGILFVDKDKDKDKDKKFIPLAPDPAETQQVHQQEQHPKQHGGHLRRAGTAGERLRRQQFKGAAVVADLHGLLHCERDPAVAAA